MTPEEMIWTAPRAVTRVLKVLVMFGAVALGVGLYRSPDRAWANMLLSGYFMLELSLGAMFFLAVHSVSGATWHVAFRRVPEAMARVLPLGAIALLVVLQVHPSLYPFASQPAATGVDTFRDVWFQRRFFLTRSVVYLACWTAFAVALVRTSHRQDAEGDPALIRRSVRLSAGFLVALAVTFVPASIDWLMSLEPGWYSTIFGFYAFAGMFLAALAAIVILVVSIHCLAPASFTVTPGHLHDLGKLLFAFSTFWMYLWFCQYMLIWYGNIPEETAYFVKRQQGPWASLFLLNPILNWGAPFVLLLSQRAKKTASVLVLAATVIVTGNLLDLYLAVLPRFLGPTPALGLLEIGLPAAAIGLFALAVFHVLGRAPLVPVRDPSLAKSIEYGLEDNRDDALEWLPE